MGEDSNKRPNPSKRSVPRFKGQPWVELLREASRGKTYPELAQITRYGRTKIAAILGGQQRPSIDELLTISNALQLPGLRMLAISGHLPGVSNLLEYVDHLEDLAARVDLAASQIPMREHVEGAAVIGAKLVRQGEYRVTTFPVWQGTDHARRHYADVVAISPLNAESSEAEARSNIEELLRYEMAWFGAGFVGDPRVVQDLETPFPRLSINIPRFVAARRGSGDPLYGAPRAVCVLGSHWSGSADIASFLGLAFDHDFAHVGLVASRAYTRLAHQWNHPLFAQDRLEVARTYIAGSDIGRRRVWAAGGDGIVDVAQLLTEAGQPEPLVVYIHASDELVDWAAHNRTQWGHTAASLHDESQSLRQERREVSRLLKRIHYRCIFVTASLPSTPTPFADLDSASQNDLLFNQWASTAEMVLAKLHDLPQAQFDLDEALRRMVTG